MLIIVKICKECGKPVDGRQYGSLGSSILHKIKFVKINKFCRECKKYGKVEENPSSLFYYSSTAKPLSEPKTTKFSTKNKRCNLNNLFTKKGKFESRKVLKGRNALIVRALSAAEYHKRNKK